MAAPHVDFRALYQSSLQLTTASPEALGLPRLEKRLAQLDDASRPVASAQGPRRKKRPATAPPGDRANFLLAAKGIDAEKLRQELEHFELAAHAPETLLGETDLEGYLAHHHEMIVLTAVEDGTRRTAEAVHDRMNRALLDDFERDKQQLLERWGSRGPQPLGVRNYPRVAADTGAERVFRTAANSDKQQQQQQQLLAAGSGLGLAGVSFAGQPHLATSATDSSSSSSSLLLHLSQTHVDNAMTDEMQQYYSVVKDLNSSRVPHTRSQLDPARRFERVCAAHVSAAVTGSKWQAVLKCWQLVNSMLAGGDATKANAPNVLERAFAAARNASDASQRTVLQHRFVFGARVFLEQQFRVFVQETVQTNGLATGGIPDLVSTIRAFIKHLHSSRYAANGSGRSTTDVDNIWAIVYYCLRCGGDQEALAVAESVARGDDAPIDADIICALRYRAEQKRLYADRNADSLNAFAQQFPAECQRLVDRYHRLVSSSIDAVSVVNPFERSVVNLLCLGNVNANEQRVMTTVEDYLWQRLCFMQRATARGSTPGRPYTITTLSQSIQRFGSAHFESGAQPGGGNFPAFLYFEILLITQEFEKAVKYLASKGFLLEAVHFAIALNYYGMLECAPFAVDEEEDETTVDLVRLIRQYIHSFQRANAAEAADYVACVPDLAAKKELLAELLLDTRKFDVLAGFTNHADGSRTRGLYDQLLKDEPEDEVKGLILAAARKAEARGRLHDAFTLLKAAGDIEGALVLLNSQLSSTLSATRPERAEWFREAKEFSELWMRSPWVQTIANRHARTVAIAFQTLLNMSIFLEVFEKQRYEDAIAFVDELEVVPTQNADTLSVCVDRFLAFDESVRQTFHVLLLGYMECLVRDADRLKTQLSGEVRRAGIAALRRKAELVVTFAGMIKYRLPTGVNERLNRMESMIY